MIPGHMPRRKILVIVGPTAIGKTALSVELAVRLNAEIISADSRQIFRYMYVGTAKPSMEERRTIPHHFMDYIDPDAYYNAGQYGKDGRAMIHAIWERHKEVLVVGGSGLYIRALIDGFIGDGMKDESVRMGIRERIAREGLEKVHHELQILDPAAAAKIHPNDAKRIERALEVYELTGKRISDKHAEPKTEFDFAPMFIGLFCERAELYRRIEARVDDMIQKGVIEETKRLMEMGYSPALTSMESLGYREIIAYLDGRIHYDRMIELFKQNSRNYAKRQLTWFRRDSRIQWYDVTAYSPEKIIEMILMEWANKGASV